MLKVKRVYPFQKGMCFTRQKCWQLELVLECLLLDLMPVSTSEGLLKKDKQPGKASASRSNQLQWQSEWETGREREVWTFPVSISYKRMPTLHQSAALSWPLPIIISGAIYSVVPHIEFALVVSSNCFASPKSVNFTWFSTSKKLFSNLRLAWMKLTPIWLHDLNTLVENLILT